MTTAEKISIALPSEMVAVVRGAVATGEYTSREVVLSRYSGTLMSTWCAVYS